MSLRFNQHTIELKIVAFIQSITIPLEPLAILLNWKVKCLSRKAYTAEPIRAFINTEILALLPIGYKSLQPALQISVAKAWKFKLEKMFFCMFDCFHLFYRLHFKDLSIYIHWYSYCHPEDKEGFLASCFIALYVT